uniref:Lysine-specific metallo-endopeptidase domain-containing protein n=1 Tax=Amphimedon queenslandica TaxID=400682 RepID=A0A1X7U3U9_AMPQE
MRSIQAFQIDKAISRVGYTFYYWRWFGAPTSDRQNQVKETFKRIKTGLTDNTVTYEDAYDSWVCVNHDAITWTYRSYPTKPYTTVYLCQSYYEDPDYCYGVWETKEIHLMNVWAEALGYADEMAHHFSSCRNLAINEPDKAVKNGYNYGYFYCASYR